jgi:DNA-binding beta-propeller fold protein YncE
VARKVSRDGFLKPGGPARADLSGGADVAAGASGEGTSRRHWRRLGSRAAIIGWLALLLGGSLYLASARGPTTVAHRSHVAVDHGHEVQAASGPPSVTSVSPDCGPAAGGTTVVIAGSGFTGASVVDFGSTAASSYTVNSDTQVTATSPAGSSGTVDITVTTSGGTSATGSGDKFTYVGCAYVPNFSSGTVSVINTALSIVTTTINLPTTGKPPRPDAVALTSDNEQLYVADPANATVYVYPTSTYVLESTSDLTTGIADPVKLDIVNVGGTSYLLVANNASNAVTAYTLSSDLPSSDTPSHTVTAPYVSGLGGLQTVFGSADVMFPATAGNAVGELNPSTWAASDVPSASGQFSEPDAIGYSTSGATAYVANETGQIYAVNTSTLAIVGAISGTSGRTSVPSALWCTTSSKCFEASAGNNTIGTISTSTSPGSMSTTPISSADISGPVAMVSVPGTSALYVVNDGGGSVGIFNSSSDSMTGLITVGTNPCGVVVMKS